MKKGIKTILALCTLAIFMQSCETVQPNYQGVLMTNFGKNGKSDFENVKGRVSTMSRYGTLSSSSI